MANDGCNAKDPAVREWTRSHENFHEKLTEDLDRISCKVRLLHKWFYIMVGALFVILYMLGVNPALVLKAVGK